jgi:hypothetical protein
MVMTFGWIALGGIASLTLMQAIVVKMHPVSCNPRSRRVSMEPSTRKLQLFYACAAPTPDLPIPYEQLVS